MTDKCPEDLSFHTEQLDSDSDVNSPLTAVSEEMRCQYSSKRCENERTHKKSGGLHKFCAMHREKANRNQMRLDQRRRVVKQQQKDMHRQQQARQMQTLLRYSPSAMAAGQNFCFNRTQRSPVGFMRSSANGRPISPSNMMINMKAMHIQKGMSTGYQSPQLKLSPELPLFDQHDLEILEALLFSSDEEQQDAAPAKHCNTSQLFCAPPIVNV